MRSKHAGTGATALIFACFLLAPAAAADLNAARAHHRVWIAHHHRIVLPPERHVIEVVRHAYGTHFIINGVPFAGKSACSLGWVAGQPVRLRAGDWHGACTEAVFYNLARRQSCAMWCPDAAD